LHIEAYTYGVRAHSHLCQVTDEVEPEIPAF
jgi:hypothetical protein